MQEKFSERYEWVDGMIECLVLEKPEEIFEPVMSRFEIMDL